VEWFSLKKLLDVASSGNFKKLSSRLNLVDKKKPTGRRFFMLQMRFDVRDAEVLTFPKRRLQRRFARCLFEQQSIRAGSNRGASKR
jgi:hypothetical protein